MTGFDSVTLRLYSSLFGMATVPVPTVAPNICQLQAEVCEYEGALCTSFVCLRSGDGVRSL